MSTIIWASSLLILAMFAPAACPQDKPPQGDVQTRQLWDTTLLDKRPSSGKPSTVKRPQAIAVKGAVVGVTVWRLRPSRAEDTRDVRALIHVKNKDLEVTPERVAAGTPLAEGQRVRISAESAQEGYLYVIDRDEYADGTKGDPYLIFPTLLTRGGNNRVMAGVVVEIPAQDDDPPYFEVDRSRPDQIDEVLTFLISPKPLAELKIGPDRQRLSAEQVSRWEKQWKASSYKLEDAAHEGKVYTVAEKEAARAGRLLTKDDPLPQTMYRVDCKAGDPVMLDVRLKIAKR